MTTGLRRFLNELEFKDEYKYNLQTTYKSFLRWHLNLIYSLTIDVKNETFDSLKFWRTKTPIDTQRYGERDRERVRERERGRREREG